MINSFLQGSSEKITLSWFQKHSTLLGFYRYALSRGYVSVIPLPKILPKRPTPFVPYVYSKKELKLLFDTALTCQRNKSYVLPEMVRMILILTYALGLRISETLRIKLADINLDDATITIWQSKFYKSRLLPFNSEVGTLVRAYLEFRIIKNQSQSIDAYLFIGRDNQAVILDTLHDVFQRIRRAAGIKRIDGASLQPRIHDLRHTFAVNRLIDWYQKDEDVNILLPILSTYLGHTSLAETVVYLSMTDKLLQAANTKFENYAFGEEK